MSRDALNAGTIISKDLLFKDVRPSDRREHGERFPLGFVEWELNGDPYFYENHHLTPRPVQPTVDDDARQWWIFYNTAKFSGKKLVVEPAASFEVTEPGVYSIFVWSGQGTYAGREVKGGDPHLDELLVTHDAAVRPHLVTNTGTDDLVVLSFFGPDLQPQAPTLPVWS